jgi:hypothetical protein
MAVLAVAALRVVSAQPALSNEDVIKLAKAGLSEEFIVNQVRTQGSHLSSDVSSLIEMRRGGVNERVLTEVTRVSPSPEPLNSDSVLRLVRAGFSDNFVSAMIMRQPDKFRLSAAKIVELKEAGVSERLLSLMADRTGARELPAGSAIVIRTIDGIDSERDRTGDEFRATLQDPIRIGDDEVAPKGSDVRLRLVEDRESGKLTGRAELKIQLVSLTVNGRTVAVNTDTVSEQSGSQGATTAKRAAAVGVVGAVIGAIAGGGKGAAVGAGAGAAAGAGSGVFMKGQKVKIPSETILTFTTGDPVRIP